jgi:hypothetical protein
MKKVFLFGALLCLVAVLAACKKNETAEGDATKAKVSHISYIDCKSHTDKLAKADPNFGDPDSVSISYADGAAHITHYNLLVNCGFEKGGIVVDLDINGSTLTIDEHENPDGPLDRCLCTTDNSFQIDNIPHGTYTLVFQNWYPEPYSKTVTF